MANQQLGWLTNTHGMLLRRYAALHVRALASDMTQSSPPELKVVQDARLIQVGQVGQVRDTFLQTTRLVKHQ